MKTTVKINSIFQNGKKQMLLLENQNWYRLELDLEKEYTIEIKELKSTRTIQQNKFMWALIHDIAKVQEMDEMKVYIQALEECNAKYEYILATEETESNLKKSFRAVKVVRPQNYNGREMYVYKCFLGSSKFNISEMKQLLDVIIGWCYELNIPTNYYENLYMKGLKKC